jgi:hypothetical protein
MWVEVWGALRRSHFWKRVISGNMEVPPGGEMDSNWAVQFPDYHQELYQTISDKSEEI